MSSNAVNPEKWHDERKQLLEELSLERRRISALQEELQKEKRLAISRQLQAEAEEERLTNKLMQRLDELKKVKLSLTPEVEAQEGLVASLKRRLEQLTGDKAQLEAKLAAEQEYITSNLLRKISEAEAEKVKLQHDKARLENTLEAEQEYISNRLSKQAWPPSMRGDGLLEQLALEKNTMMADKLELRRQVNDLAAEVDKLNRDKVALEIQFEREEENVVNKLQRQLQAVTIAYCGLESKLESAGISPREPGAPSLDHNIEWVYGRSPSRHSARMAAEARDRSRSSSRTDSFRAGGGSGAYPGTPSASSTPAGGGGQGGLERWSPHDLPRRSSSTATSKPRDPPPGALADGLAVAVGEGAPPGHASVAHH